MKRKYMPEMDSAWEAMGKKGHPKVEDLKRRLFEIACCAAVDMAGLYDVRVEIERHFAEVFPEEEE